MQITETNSVLSTTCTKSVVSHDTATPNTPSIKLGTLSVPATVVVTARPIDELKSLEQARISWENIELVTSNTRLYSILKQAYSFYMVMKKDENKTVRTSHADGLEQLIKERKYSFLPTTHDITRVVKCVFGVDRRRVSAYSIALREALRQEIDTDDLIVFIESNGGVEQIRLGSTTKPVSSAKRAELVKNEVLNSNIGKLKIDAKLSGANADWIDKQVIIVATYLPTGEFEANAVIKHDVAVNAALAAYYSNQQADIRVQRKAEKDAEKTSAKTDSKVSNDAQKLEAKKSKVQAMQLASAHQAKANSSFQAVFA